MSKITDQPGTQIHLDLIVDHERGRVQIIRNIDKKRGFLVTSGNMGWVELGEFKQFLDQARVRVKSKPTLFEVMTGKTIEELGGQK